MGEGAPVRQANRDNRLPSSFITPASHSQGSLVNNHLDSRTTFSLQITASWKAASTEAPKLLREWALPSWFKGGRGDHGAVQVIPHCPPNSQTSQKSQSQAAVSPKHLTDKNSLFSQEGQIFVCLFVFCYWSSEILAQRTSSTFGNSINERDYYYMSSKSP